MNTIFTNVSSNNASATNADKRLEVYFGDTITKIPNNLFQGATYLRKIHLSNSINEIGEYAFENTDIKEVIFF